jgi:hypothetical protein
VKAAVPVVSFLAILLDMGSMFMVRYVMPQFAVGIILAGALIGLCALIETIVPLYELWLKKD